MQKETAGKVIGGVTPGVTNSVVNSSSVYYSAPTTRHATPRAEAFRVASHVVQSRRAMPHHPSTPTPAVAAPLANFSGVHFSDAADGEIALIVYIRGKRVIRLEICQEYYSATWVRWLNRWAQRQQPAALKLVD